MIDEKNIRNYLKSLTEKEIINSVYLYSLDFDNDTFNEILNSIAALYNEVDNMNKIIVSRFEKNAGKVLTPEQSAVQLSIIQDYQKKSSVLEKILMNDNIYDAVETRIFEVKKDTGRNI